MHLYIIKINKIEIKNNNIIQIKTAYKKMELINSLRPIYISDTNVVTPITSITFDTLHDAITICINILHIIIETTLFIIKEGISLIIYNISQADIIYVCTIIIYIICIIVYIIAIYLSRTINNQKQQISEQKHQIEQLVQNVYNLDVSTLESIKHIDKKFAVINKKMKKLEKDFEKYE